MQITSYHKCKWRVLWYKVVKISVAYLMCLNVLRAALICLIVIQKIEILYQFRYILSLSWHQISYEWYKIQYSFVLFFNLHGHDNYVPNFANTLLTTNDVFNVTPNEWLQRNIDHYSLPTSNTQHKFAMVKNSILH